jgi:hypothetical protein
MTGSPGEKLRLKLVQNCPDYLEIRMPSGLLRGYCNYLSCERLRMQQHIYKIHCLSVYFFVLTFHLRQIPKDFCVESSGDLFEKIKTLIQIHTFLWPPVCAIPSNCWSQDPHNEVATSVLGSWCGIYCTAAGPQTAFSLTISASRLQLFVHKYLLQLFIELPLTQCSVNTDNVAK